MSPPGRVLVVTGGSGGIGLGTAKAWIGRGGRVVSLDRCPPPEDVGASLLHVEADVTVEEAVRNGLAAGMESFGRIDAVFHNAGTLGTGIGDGFEVDVAGWRALLDVHLVAGLMLAGLSLPHLRASSSGAIVFNASITGLGGSASHPAYAAAKAGLVSLAASLARTLGRYRIRVNAVCPGSVVGTGLWEAAMGRGMTPSELATLATSIPMRRAARPADIADAVCFLASDEARHITGAALPVDGGERFV